MSKISFADGEWEFLVSGKCMYISHDQGNDYYACQADEDLSLEEVIELRDFLNKFIEGKND